MSRSITRRAAVLAGLGALSLAPTAALADLVTSTGYRADGSAYTGLVTAHGKTYLYEAGVLFKGGAKDYRGSRYFSTDDGHMAADEWVKVGSNSNHYGTDGVLDSSVSVPDSGSGWTELDGCWFYMENGEPKTGWLVTDEAPGIADNPGSQRYWLDRETGALAVNETVEYADGQFAHSMPQGYVARGAMNDGNNRVYFADNDGKLLCMDKGWHVGSDLVASDGLQRFWMNGDGSAKTSFFEVDGEQYWGLDEGYVLRGKKLDKSANEVVVADNDGKISRRFTARALTTASYDGTTHPAWDFEDWDFVERQQQYAESNSSSSDWFLTVDVDAPVRCVIWHRERDVWVPAGGWYCCTGRKYYPGIHGGLPRESGGYHTLTNRWLPNTPRVPTGPGYAVDFIEYYPSPDVNDSASLHAGRALGEWGYATHSCIGVTDVRARWFYDNLTYGTGMYISGSCAGIWDEEENLMGEEVYAATIVNPFA